MRQEKDLKLSDSQKKRIIQWEIPHLIAVFKSEYEISAMHLISPAFFSPVHKTDWLTFDGKTGFPVFAGKNSLGVLICFNALNYLQAQNIRNYINVHLEKVFLKFISGRDSLSVSAQSSVLDELSLPDFALSSDQDFHFLFDKERRIEEVSSTLNPKSVSSPNSEENNKQREISDRISIKDKAAPSFFPLLLKQGKKEDLLKQAHELYLRTSSFAFLNTEDLNWKKGVFQEMNGVFVCVPFFHQLSDFQKKILIQDLLKDKLSCRLVMGIQKEEELPANWKDLFRCVL